MDGEKKLNDKEGLSDFKPYIFIPINKKFNDGNIYHGEVKSGPFTVWDETGCEEQAWTVVYDNGESEDLNKEELYEYSQKKWVDFNAEDEALVKTFFSNKEFQKFNKVEQKEILQKECNKQGLKFCARAGVKKLQKLLEDS